MKMRAMQTEIDGYEEKTERWKGQIQQAMEAKSSAETKLSDSEKQVKNSKHELALVEAERDLLQKGITQLNDDKVALSTETGKLQSEISEKNSTIGKLERQLERMTNDFEWAKLRWNEYYGLQYRSAQEIEQLKITNKDFLKLLEGKCEGMREQTFLTNQANKKVQVLESQMGSVQAELKKAREEVIVAEQQLTDAKLAWEEEKVELRGSVELWKNVATDKDDTIQKLEKKIQKIDMESALSRSALRLGKSLDSFSASQQSSPVRRPESSSCQSASKRRPSQGSRKDEHSSTALPSSSEVPTPGELSTAFLNPSTPLNKPPANVDDEQVSTDSGTTPRRARHTHHLGMSHRSMIPAPVGYVSSRIEKSSSTLPSPLVSAGRGQMMTPGGLGPTRSTSPTNL
jgi:chromosome segregation ATPase